MVLDLYLWAKERQSQSFTLPLSLVCGRERRFADMTGSNRRVPLNNETQLHGRYASTADAGLSRSEGPRALSLEWILEVAPKGSPIVGVGAGRSMLLPGLLYRDYTDLTHVDWSESAALSVQRSLGC